MTLILIYNLIKVNYNFDWRYSMSNISEKQKKAADNFIKTGDKKKSAVMAGYSETGYQRVFDNENVKKYLKEKMIQKNIVSEDEVLTYLSNVMTGKEEDISVKDRLKAAELLGKKYGIYTDKMKINEAIPIIIKDDVNE